MKITFKDILLGLTLALVVAIPVSGIFSVKLFFILLIALCVVKFFDFLTLNFHRTEMVGFCFILVALVSVLTNIFGYNKLCKNELENGAHLFVAKVSGKHFYERQGRYSRNRFVIYYTLNNNGRIENREIDNADLFHKVAEGIELIMMEPLRLRGTDRVLAFYPSEELKDRFRNGVYARMFKDTNWETIENDVEIQAEFQEPKVEKYYSMFYKYRSWIWLSLCIIPTLLSLFSLKLSGYMMLLEVFICTILAWYLRIEFNYVKTLIMFCSGVSLLDRWTLAPRQKFELKRYGGFFTIGKAVTTGSEKKRETKCTYINAWGEEKTNYIRKHCDGDIIIAFCIVNPNFIIEFDVEPNQHIIEKFKNGIYYGPGDSLDLELMQDDPKMREPFRDSLRKFLAESED